MYYVYDNPTYMVANKLICIFVSCILKPPELIDQPCWSATEFVNKSWLPAKLMRFEDVNPVAWAYLA